MRKRNGVILAVIGYIVFFFCMDGWGEDWKLYATAEEGIYYYDTNIIRLSNRLIKVRTKSSLNDKGRLWWVEEMGEQFKNIGSDISLLEWDCLDKKFRTLSIIFIPRMGLL